MQTQTRLERIAGAYIVPAAVFQSINIGAGYATGRELVEYFTRYGGIGGALGLTLAALLLGLVLAATYEFARCFRVYDYRSFFRRLIGPWWHVFEVLYLTMAAIALAVVAAAAGKMTSDYFSIPRQLGVFGMMVMVGAMTFYGRELVKRVLTYTSAVLYAVLIVYAAAVALRFAPEIAGSLRHGDIEPGWLIGGSVYAMYSAAAIPSVLFAIRGIETRREAVLSGFFSAWFFIIPAFLFHFSFLISYPDIVQAELPVFEIITLLGFPALVVAYTIVMFATLVETGTGITQAVNDRIDAALIESRGRPATRRAHAAVGVVGLTVSVLLSQFGIIALVAKGYGLLAWGFLVAYIIPLFTVGLRQIHRRRRHMDNS